MFNDKTTALQMTFYRRTSAKKIIKNKQKQQNDIGNSSNYTTPKGFRNFSILVIDILFSRSAEPTIS